jgi:hypothetical protein
MTLLNPFAYPGLIVAIVAIYTAAFTAWGLTLEYTGRAIDAMPQWLEDMDKTSARRLIFAALCLFWLCAYHLIKWGVS